MHDSMEKYLLVLERILQYLKAIIGRWSLFKRDASPTVKTYINVDYVGLASDRRYTLGHCTYLCGNIIAWRGKN